MIFDDSIVGFELESFSFINSEMIKENIDGCFNKEYIVKYQQLNTIVSIKWITKPW
jgi:hypothetical protein